MTTDGALASAPLPAPALAQLGRWLEEHDGAAGPLEAERCAGGYSNLTFRLRDTSGRSWILRRPPLGHQGGQAHDILREARVLLALGASDIPVPAVLTTSAAGPDIGFTYVLVEHVVGHVLADQAGVEAHLHPEKRAALAHAFVAVLARIHAVSPAASGLEARPREGTYFTRQVERWAAPRADDVEDGELEAQLRAAAGTLPGGLVLLHGDFHLGNVIVGPAGEVAAVLDWEMAALGDPLVDLGCALAYWQEPGDDSRLAPLPSAAPGFPSRRRMATAYGEAAGSDLDGLDVYVAFGHWKLARIAADIRVRLARGAMGSLQLDPAMLEEQVVARRAAALAALRGAWSRPDC